MADNPFKIALGTEVVVDDLNEIVRVTARLDEEGKEPKYRVSGYSAIDGDLEGWYRFEDLTV